MDILNRLTHPIFKDFTLAELNYLLKITTITIFNEGDILIHEGDKARTLFVILEGKVAVTKEGQRPGETTKLATLGENSVLGEISVITNEPRTATVTAVIETKALVLDIIVVEQDPNAKPLHEKLLRNLTTELSKKLAYSHDRLVTFDTETQYEEAQIEDKSAYIPKSILLLFGWKWADIMYEVPFLAQHGYDAIKLYPPQEFVVRKGNPWWAIYQPVTYELSKFYGSKEDFVKMVDFCHTFNIKVYVDLVMNHMADCATTESEHIGTNGHTFSKYHYGPLNADKDVYEYDDFYHFTAEGNLGISNEDYSSLSGVWNLEHYDLLNLPKLNFENPHVIAILRKYIKYFLSLGIDGFRIDASKHIKIEMMKKIFDGLRTSDGLKPFIYQEYYAGLPLGTETYSYMEKYFKVGYVTSFNYGDFLSAVIQQKSDNLQKLVEYSFGSAWIHFPENRTVVVLDNHDTERMMPSMLNYKNSHNNAYVLAYVFMLSWPFGIPKVMSSFRFETMDDPIPTKPVWQNSRNTCFDKDSPWVAQHRWGAICNMVLFRNKTHPAQGISHIWANGNQVAFARTYQKPHGYVTSLGFVIINNTDSVLNRRFETGLPAGKYYNLISSTLTEGKMQGPTITIENYGFANIEVEPYDATVLLIDFTA
jgi:alpha-amylase